MRASAPFVLVVLIGILVWLPTHGPTDTLPSFLSAVAAMVAAIFASKSAQANRDAVEEMRRARLQDTSPVFGLTIEDGSVFYELAGDEPLTFTSASSNSPTIRLKNIGRGGARDILFVSGDDFSENIASKLKEDLNYIGVDFSTGRMLLYEYGDEEICEQTGLPRKNNFSVIPSTYINRSVGFLHGDIEYKIDITNEFISGIAIRYMSEYKSNNKSPIISIDIPVIIYALSANSSYLRSDFVINALCYFKPRPSRYLQEFFRDYADGLLSPPLGIDIKLQCFNRRR